MNDSPEPTPEEIDASLEETQVSMPLESGTELASELSPGVDAPTELNVLGADVSPVGLGIGQAALARPGEVVIKDRFVLEERLGRGGMGQIFKARDLRKEEAQDDDPYLAIKFLGDEFSHHPMALISLQREAKKSQQLAHPNILTVYDFDRDGDRVFMTMELLQGAPLSNWQSLEFAEDIRPTIAALVDQISRGLAYAHQYGVVHSDLKPDNVYVTNEGRVKILDFGIARIMDSAVQKDSFDAGELGAVTLRYASLEMIEGEAEPAPSDDVYALGLIVYQLYTGKHPYGGKNAKQAQELSLTAEPIRDIKRHQWRAISHAIELKREDRTESAEHFMRQFGGVSVRNKVTLAAVLFLALSSAYLGYQATLREGPAVAFSELPTAVQAQFEESLELGRKSAAIQDWDGASRYFIAAYDLHPRNADAEQGLEQLAQQLVDIAPRMESRRQQEYLLSMIESFRDNEYLANQQELNSVKVGLESQLAGD
jgi:serine/threonine protein kinase